MWLINKIWGKLKGLFKKRPPSTKQIISEERTILTDAVKEEDIYIKIQESIDDNEKDNLIKQIARQKVAKEIIEFVENSTSSVIEKKKGSKNFYFLHELRTELLKLEEQRAILHIAESKIQIISYPDTSSFDDRINKLFSLLSKNKIDDKVELSDFTISAFDRDFKQLEKLLQEKSTLKRHVNREREKQKQHEIYESKIKKELNNLDSLIGQNKLEDAKLLVNRLSKSIKPDYKKGVERLAKALTKLKKKELDIFERRQAELLKQQAERVRKIKELQEHRRNQEALEKKKLIEYQTNYSIQLQADSDNFSCNTILKHRKQNNLYNNLERGVALLKGDKELKQYIYSYGNMHIAKLKSAFQFLITSSNFSHTSEQIEIFDWGCGQGLGSIALIDQLKIHKNKNELIEKITLIEPGTDALKRAAFHASLALKSESKINPINKYIDTTLNDKDLNNKKHSIKIHIFSNIIDVSEVDIDLINGLITSKMSGVNYIVCVGPRFGDSKDINSKDIKMDYFANSFKYCNDFKIISNREDDQGWNHHKTWTRKEIIFKINLQYGLIQ